MNLTVAHQVSPAAGEVASGDAVVVRRDVDGVALLGVVDVLGHGPEAARVAAAATAFLLRAPVTTAEQLLVGLHEALRGTRGAAATLCVLRGARLDGCGVGNVELRVVGSPVAVLLSPGIVGQHVPRLRPFGGVLAAGDRLVCFSDGISSRVPLGDLRGLSPRDACTVMIQRHRRAHDDASVVIADLGEAA